MEEPNYEELAEKFKGEEGMKDLAKQFRVKDMRIACKQAVDAEVFERRNLGVDGVDIEGLSSSED